MSALLIAAYFVFGAGVVIGCYAEALERGDRLKLDDTACAICGLLFWPMFIGWLIWKRWIR